MLNNIVDTETSLYELQTIEVSKCISHVVQVQCVWFYITFVLYSTENKYRIAFASEERLFITNTFDVVIFFLNVMLSWRQYDLVLNSRPQTEILYCIYIEIWFFEI